MAESRSSSQSIAASGTFQSMVGNAQNPDMGVVLWCGDTTGIGIFERNQRVRKVVACEESNFRQVYKDIVWVVAVVFAGQHINTVKELSAHARKYCYEMGIAVPIYACTANSDQAFECGMDVVAPVGDWQKIAEGLVLKLCPREPQLNVVWCDPGAANPTMAAMVEPLAKLGLNVELVKTAEELYQRMDETVAAVVTSARGIPMLARIRKKLREDSCRPLFWVVSLTAKTADCYASGADAAIVCDNDTVLQAQSKHLRLVDPQRPWMWNVVVGDLLAHLQATGVARLGGVQWSLPKRYDDLQWRQEHQEMLFKRGSAVFVELATASGLDPVSIRPNEYAPSFESRFQNARQSLKGYVRDRVLYHGTDEEAAMEILQNGMRPSQEGMYGPGGYFVDPTALRKALFFALTKTDRRDSSDRGARSERTRGAIIAFRAAMCDTPIITEVPGESGWYGRRSPCGAGQDSLIGVHRGGYDGCGSRAHCSDVELNEMPEYVIRSPDFLVPIGIAIFKKRGST